MCPFLRTDVILKSNEIWFFRFGRKKRKRKKKKKETITSLVHGHSRSFRNRQTRSRFYLSFSVLISPLCLSAPVLGSLKLSSMRKGGVLLVTRRFILKKSSVSSQRSAPTCNKEIKGNKTEKENVPPRSSKWRLSISRSCFAVFCVPLCASIGR